MKKDEIKEENDLSSDNINNFRSRLSLNDNFHQDDKSEKTDFENNDELEYRYERRLGRQFSINHNFLRDEKFNKVIIPYNFQRKKYDIKDKDIEFYENRDYLKEKLSEFNNNPDFDIEKIYYPKRFSQKLKIYIPIITIMIILIYIGAIITMFFCFNPIVIYTIYSWIRKAYNSLRMFKFILLEKFKMKEIQKMIDNENISEICRLNKIIWKIGQSGYWLEIQKILT